MGNAARRRSLWLFKRILKYEEEIIKWKYSH
jgi:hypothetical protein